MSDNRSKDEIKQAMREAADFFTPFVDKNGRLNATKVLAHISRIERERDEALEWDRRSKAALLDAGRRIAALEAENAALRADAERYRWLCGEHDRVDPLARVSWKSSDNRHSSIWVNVGGSAYLTREIDRARKGVSDG